jgi:hypothetical protein
MNEHQHGDVVIVSTGQAGTYCSDNDSGAEVLLANGDIWIGPPHQLTPATLEMCLAAPRDHDRFKNRETKVSARVDKSKKKAKSQEWTKEFDEEDEDY